MNQMTDHDVGSHTECKHVNGSIDNSNEVGSNNKTLSPTMFTKERKRQDYFVLFYYEGEERIKKNKIKW